MRVTLVVNSFDEGSETFLHTLAAQLVDLGHEVTVHALLDGRTTMVTGSAFQAGTTVRRSEGLPSVRSSNFALMVARLAVADAAAVSAGIRRAVTRYGGIRAARAAALAVPLLATRPEVVHVAFSGIGVALVDALELLDDETKVVVSCRGTGELVAPQLDPSIRPDLRRLLGRADAVHAVSDVVAAAVIELGAPSARVRVIRPAVDVERFTRSRPLSPRGDVFRVVTVARLHWIKAVDVQLAAAAELHRKGLPVRWTIVGDGPERPQLEFRAGTLDLSEIVHFVGAASPDRVRTHLENADVFVLSSLSEGTANSVLEAMALGIPIVSSSAGGMGEVLSHEVDSLLVPPGDPVALAASVERLAADAMLAEELRLAGERSIRRDFTLDRQRREWGSLYRAIGERTRPDGARS